MYTENLHQASPTESRSSLLCYCRILVLPDGFQETGYEGPLVYICQLLGYANTVLPDVALDDLHTSDKYHPSYEDWVLNDTIIPHGGSWRVVPLNDPPGYWCLEWEHSLDIRHRSESIPSIDQGIDLTETITGFRSHILMFSGRGNPPCLALFASASRLSYSQMDC